jgi:aminopeptidase N
MWKDAQPSAVKLADYRPPEFRITDTLLSFEITEGVTEVTSTLQLERNDEAEASESGELRLDGQALELRGVAIDGRALSENEFAVDDDSLTLFDVPPSCSVQIVTRIHPEQNTALQGLYRSKLMYCTQCEAQGFRRITYYLDRPDVLSRFTTQITTAAQGYPVALSNGNLTSDEQLEDGRRRVTWHDPFPKPSYLFALVAGDLDVIEDVFVTRSGRRVVLKIYSEAHNIDQCDYAMAALKRAMRWDEEAYGREYDLDIFMIVAVEDFNMGAMENKGLNIFNTSCVLASKDTATDAGYQRVEAVVAHEYFHNWSGNRVTCRDWFQLSLKEGFTVLRDAEFSAAMNSATVKRIEDVSFLRTFQFPEDAGPLAHPIRPDSYIEISNFYTTTVYEKGAEVVRMIRTLLGDQRFRQGTDLYFDRHDGQAVTTEDFVVAMEDANAVDLDQFRRWYRQAGTPGVEIEQRYADGALQVTFTQSCPATPGQPEKAPFHLPLAIGLLDSEGRELLGEAGRASLVEVFTDAAVENPNGDGTLVVQLREAVTTVRFDGLKARPVLSPLRGFSAPVHLYGIDETDDLRFLAEHDSDGFARWDAIRLLQSRSIHICREAEPDEEVASLVALYQRLINTALDAPDAEQKAMAAAMLVLPGEGYLHEQMAEIDVDGVHRGRAGLLAMLGTTLFDQWRALYRANAASGPYRPDPPDIARRSLKNVALSFLAAADAESEHIAELIEAQFEDADNLTDRLAALREILELRELSEARRRSVIDSFYDAWKDEKLVVDQWFTVQSARSAPDALARVLELEQHPAFDRSNPNRVRALYGAFCGQNPVNFHALDGGGYAFLAERVLGLDANNPQLAARLLTPLTRGRRLDGKRRALIRQALEGMASREGLSPDVYELVTKSLAASLAAQEGDG